MNNDGPFEFTTDYPDEDYDDGLEMHPYALATAESEREAQKRELERERGRIYNDIQFREKKKELSARIGVPLELLNKNPALEALIHHNFGGTEMLTVSTCALLPDFIEEAHHSRPLWVMHLPDESEDAINGCCFFSGVSESPINAMKMWDTSLGLEQKYLTWDMRKRDKIYVPAADIMYSLKEADAGEGAVVIAFVGKESFSVKERWIPSGLVEWIEGPPSPPSSAEPLNLMGKIVVLLVRHHRHTA